jgi:hypothetical protein
MTTVFNHSSFNPSVQFAARKKATSGKAKQAKPVKTQPSAEKQTPIHLHAAAVLNEAFPYVAGLEGNAIPRNGTQDVSLTIDSTRLDSFATMLSAVTEGVMTLTPGTLPRQYVFEDADRNERVNVMIAPSGGYGYTEPNQPSGVRQISKPRPVGQGPRPAGRFRKNNSTK